VSNYDAERAEYERLVNEINRVENRIRQVEAENIVLEAELAAAITNVVTMTENCEIMDQNVYDSMSGLSKRVGSAELNTKAVFQALNELSTQYFTYKNLSTASKNLTQYTDEYNTKFATYHDLRRITLGYIIGLDINIIQSETLRKKVEKAYLQNTEYWLAYCITAVMLWSSNEKEAAYRAVNKSLSMSYFKSSLFFLLINLRFGRLEAAKKWYLVFLDRADVNDLGDEWQYLLQAYLFGAFGADEEFQEQVAKSFRSMLSQAEATTVDMSLKFKQKALDFAVNYIHKTENEYPVLRRTCAEYEGMKDLLSEAEKNSEIARYYNNLAEKDIDEAEDLPQRIENVLYSLVNDYDDDEEEVVKKIKYNEAIMNAKGDVTMAQRNFSEMFASEGKRKNLADMMLEWAFATDTSQTDISVRKFAISFMKDPITEGLEQFPDTYRDKERTQYQLDIDDCKLVCNENGYTEAANKIEEFYNNTKLKRRFKDKQVLIYTGLCAVSLLMIASLIMAFSPVVMTFGILIGLVGSFLLWRRLVDMGKIIEERKRKSKLLLKQALDEMADWRSAYKEADAHSTDIAIAMEQF